jgi:hypothetical protein
MLKLIDLLVFQVIIDECLDCGRLWCDVVYCLIYLLPAIVLTPGGSMLYTFTHKQYAEQHNEAEYTERNISNNKNTYTQQPEYITIRIRNLQN